MYVSNSIPETEGFLPEATSNSSTNQGSGKKEVAQKENLMKGLCKNEDMVKGTNKG